MLTRRILYVFVAVVLILGLSQVAAQANLKVVGPIIPTDPADPEYTGYPRWYRDANGLAAELPNGNAIDPVSGLPFNQHPSMVMDPPVPGNAFSSQIGFGAEAFYWMVVSDDMQIFQGANLFGTGSVELAVEAAFGAEVPVDGDQAVFSRLRMRIDVPPGEYTILHPYGEHVVTVVDGGRRAINETIDIGLAPGIFSPILQSPNVGPFLIQANPPPTPGFFGTGTPGATITGGPVRNFVQIQGVGITSAPVTTFSVWGKIFTRAAFKVSRTTFSRDAAGAVVVDVFANQPTPRQPGLQVRARQGANVVTLTKNQNLFFGQLPLPSLPPFVNITGFVNGNFANSNITINRVPGKDLVDLVTVSQAEFNLTAGNLTITAATSDLAPTTTLSVFVPGIGQVPLVNGTPSVIPLSVPPNQVTVKSSSGGQGSLPVTIIP